MQAKLWGRYPLEWSTIQEAIGKEGYDHALQILNLSGQESLLDVGCGAGFFCTLAAPKTRFITGLDATVELVEVARHRLPAYPFLVGEMEELPLPDEAYDIVTGFNSFQYAATIANALAEARRVLKPGGRLVVMIWGNKQDCEAASFLAAVGSLLPPPPPARVVPSPFQKTNCLKKPSKPQASPSGKTPTSPAPGTIPMSIPPCAACSPPAPPSKPSILTATTKSPKR